MSTNDGADRLLFGKGVLGSGEQLHVYGSLASDEEAARDRSFVLNWDGSAWSLAPVEARICAIASRVVDGEDEVSALAIDGRLHVSRAGLEHWDHLDMSEAGPNALRHATCLRAIGDDLVAAGMGRMLYVNRGGRRWTRHDDELRVPRDSMEVAGILAIDGAGIESLVSVGFGGEIWSNAQGGWHRLESPTNAKLEAVAVVAEDDIVIAGAAGLIFRGGPRGWVRVDHGLTADTFWSISLVGDRLLLATGEGEIFCLTGTVLERVELGVADHPTSTRWLDGLGARALSVGLNDIWIGTDGSWTRVATPQD